MNNDNTANDTRLEALFRVSDESLGEGGTLILELTLYAPQSQTNESRELYAALRVGDDKLYTVRDITRFLQKLERGEAISFGSKLHIEPDEFDPMRAFLFDSDRKIMRVLLEIISAANTAARINSAPDAIFVRSYDHKRFMRIPRLFRPRLFSALSLSSFRLIAGAQAFNIKGVSYEQIPVSYELTEYGNGMRLHASFPQDMIPLTDDMAYVYTSGRVICDKNKERLRLIAATVAGQVQTRQRGSVFIDIPRNQTVRFVREALPWLCRSAAVKFSDTLSEKIKRGDMSAKVYLDRERREITARVEFIYDETSVIHAFTPDTQDVAYIMRDISAERRILDVLSRFGFHVRRGFAHLSNSNRIIEFFQNGVKELGDYAEVFASERFRKMRPRRPSLSVNISQGRGKFVRFLLEMDGNATREADGILEALRERRRYFLLEDGDILDLSEFSGMQDISASLLDSLASGAARHTDPTDLASAIEARLFTLPEWIRLAGDGVHIEEGLLNVRESLLNEDGSITAPDVIADKLRDYQKRGFGWMTNLYKNELGGVLADDMGLGKTIQALAVIQKAKDEQGQKPTLVVAPTSLLYNWESEVKKFMPGLSCVIVDGAQAKRNAVWEEVLNEELKMKNEELNVRNGNPQHQTKTNNSSLYDIIVVSYPIIRRDIEQIERISFRMVILDEAQQIKNAKAQAAGCVKRIASDARFALTGTPLENHPAELWSIFDFVLPGLLS
ncbi:MAG: SNF2 helicase associated domain-containing protein, partial [Oscillospiraceae bacterium]|nr:SNF2 helicase associated domain-containing protein [Oscillospiraceae bacterium]